MIFRGSKVPYVEVASEFARNPAAYSYKITPLVKGGGRIQNKRLQPMEISIPVVFSRRGNEVKTWDDIKTVLAGILYGDRDENLSFMRGDGRYYRAQIVAIEITEEYDYSAKGNIVFVSGNPSRFGDDQTLSTSTSAMHEINGQISTPWTSKTTFAESASQYTLTSSAGNIELNYEFISGDVLRIDYETRSITLNGINIDVGLSLNSVWFDLHVGYMSLEASHETELTYTERYN